MQDDTTTEKKAPDSHLQWADTLLTKDELKDVTFVRNRLLQLKNARRDMYPDVEKVWADADADYVPRVRTTGRGKRIIADDEDKGWRGVVTTLTGSSAWRSNVQYPNPYVKIQAALAVLVDQNPVGVFFPITKKFQATTELIKQLYQRSWDVARSKQQLKLFIFNLSKYGWAIGRSYPLKVERTVKAIKEWNEDDPDKTTYETKEVVEFDDIMRENLDPWNAWIDDMAKPSNQFTMRDWCWRKVYSYDDAEEEFGKWTNFKYVPKSGGVTTARLDTKSKTGNKAYVEPNLVEVYFYESVQKDLFQVHIAGVPVVNCPLPISNANGLKRLSCWQTFWNIRDSECPYGIGLYEAIRPDTQLLDQFRNMSLDQLKLSVLKMFFYQGTQALTETGDMEITPGKGKQVLNPKDITWLEVPGPGKEAWDGIEKLQEGIDQISGITPQLLGEVTGKTAFELAQAKEAALKRLKTPLDNITDALGTEAYVTLALIQLIYSIPEVVAVTDKDLVDDYMQEIQGDTDLYERDDKGVFNAKIYREFPLKVNADEEGNLIETQDTRFFRVKPKFLQWEGVVNVKPQSVLSPSKQVEKALETEMYNILIPLLQPLPDPTTGQDSKPALYSKIAQSIVRLYDKDPRDVLPAAWLGDGTPPAPEGPQSLAPGQPPLFVSAGGPGGQPGAAPAPTPTQQTNAPQLVSQATAPVNPTGLGKSIVSKFSNALRGQ